MPLCPLARKYEKWTDSRGRCWHTPGMHRYGQYCPVAKAAEVLGERWTLLIVRDVMEGAHRFTDLRAGLPGLSRTVLTQRLRLLEREGVIERRGGSGGRGEYWLTTLGEDLQPALFAIGEWASRNYAREPKRDELDPTVLMLWIQRHIRGDGLPSGRAVFRFEFRGARPPRAWLLIEDGVPSVCRDDPGFECDLVIWTDLVALNRVFAGRLALSAALRDGSVRLEGTATHARAFPRWFGLSPFAKTAWESLAS